MRKIHVRLSYILAAFLFIGSIFLTPYYTTLAQEPEDTDVIQDDHSTFSDEMLQAAIKRYQRPMLRNVDPSGDTEHDPAKVIDGASLPYIGKGSVLALHISFPNDTENPVNQAHPAEDSAEALQAALSHLHDYYLRASYGKLEITGDVISYDAQKPRGEYEGTEVLLAEVLHALDEEYDFSKYDADEDGFIDCVYMHIPYNSNDRWSSTWWPNCAVDYSKSIEVDGKLVASYVTLSRNVGEQMGVQTLVHESGHAMGFPDYYSYDKDATENPKYPTLSGTLTFDMMDNNTGDHNGFSKWIAGWLDDDDVIRVYTVGDEVYAYRGTEEVGIRNEEDGSITLDLYSFDTEEVSNTGGIIVVGENVSTPFSNYYMLQYDTFAGNQKVYYNRETNAPITSGFRVYRVQAEVVDGHLVHSNTYDVLFNKLVELVDHDYKEDHLDAGYPYASISIYEKEPYGCMFYKGDTLTPITDPSTNFRENIGVGFTGIYMEFLESNDEYGTVKIWCSEEEKPEEEDFELTFTGADAIPGGYYITFEANQLFAQNLQYGVYGVIDNNASVLYYLRYLKIFGTTLSGKLYCDPDLLKKGSTLEMRFTEGAFQTSGGKESPRMTIDIPISPDLVELTESGYIPNTEIINSDYGDKGVHKFTPVLRAEDGTYFFYSFSNTYGITDYSILYKYSFTDEAPSELKSELIVPGTDEFNEIVEWNHAQLRGDPTENAAIVPEGAQLGEFPYVFDAVKIDDYYYVLSLRKQKGWDVNNNQIALSKLNADGTLVKQVAPIADDIAQDPSTYGFPNVMIQQGPNKKLAVLAYRPYQTIEEFHLINHAGTFFYDQDLNFESRLDNFSTGCGTWLEDGRYIAFTGRSENTIELSDQGIDRTIYINYDITGVIDPAPEIEYTANKEDGEESLTWETGSDDILQIKVDRKPENDAATCENNFRGVSVDGNKLTEGKDYTVTFASVHISLLPEYLETLSAGTHTLTVHFEDGNDPKIQFEIRQKTSPAPNTGDEASSTLWIVLMAAAFAVIVVAVVLLAVKRKRK